MAIASNDVTETYVAGVLEQSRDVPAGERDRIAAARHAAARRTAGRSRRYRRVDLDEALGLLAPQPERRLVAV